jgi:hypothetical protein
VNALEAEQASALAVRSAPLGGRREQEVGVGGRLAVDGR